MAIPTIFDALAKAVADANAKAKATATAPVTTPAKTTTTAPKTSTPSLIQDIKTSLATGKSLLQVIKERQATPTKTETIVTAPKTTIATPSNIVTSPLNPFEQLIGKTNPALAQKMYDSRTGKTVTAPPSIVVTETKTATIPSSNLTDTTLAVWEAGGKTDYRNMQSTNQRVTGGTTTMYYNADFPMKNEGEADADYNKRAVDYIIRNEGINIVNNPISVSDSGHRVLVSWEDKSGKTIDVSVRVDRLNDVQSEISGKGGRIVKVYEDGTGGNIYFKQPTTDEWESAVKHSTGVYYETRVNAMQERKDLGIDSSVDAIPVKVPDKGVIGSITDFFGGIGNEIVANLGAFPEYTKEAISLLRYGGSTNPSENFSKLSTAWESGKEGTRQDIKEGDLIGVVGRLLANPVITAGIMSGFGAGMTLFTQSEIGSQLAFNVPKIGTLYEGGGVTVSQYVEAGTGVLFAVPMAGGLIEAQQQGRLTEAIIELGIQTPPMIGGYVIGRNWALVNQPRVIEFGKNVKSGVGEFATGTKDVLMDIGGGAKEFGADVKFKTTSLGYDILGEKNAVRISDFSNKISMEAKYGYGQELFSIKQDIAGARNLFTDVSTPVRYEVSKVGYIAGQEAIAGRNALIDVSTKARFNYDRLVHSADQDVIGAKRVIDNLLDTNVRPKVNEFVGGIKETFRPQINKATDIGIEISTKMDFGIDVLKYGVKEDIIGARNVGIDIATKSKFEYDRLLYGAEETKVATKDMLGEIGFKTKYEMERLVFGEKEFAKDLKQTAKEQFPEINFLEEKIGAFKESNAPFVHKKAYRTTKEFKRYSGDTLTQQKIARNRLQNIDQELNVKFTGEPTEIGNLAFESTIKEQPGITIFGEIKEQNIFTEDLISTRAVGVIEKDLGVGKKVTGRELMGLSRSEKLALKVNAMKEAKKGMRYKEFTSDTNLRILREKASGDNVVDTLVVGKTELKTGEWMKEIPERETVPVVKQKGKRITVEIEEVMPVLNNKQTDMFLEKSKMKTIEKGEKVTQEVDIGQGSKLTMKGESPIKKIEVKSEGRHFVDEEMRPWEIKTEGEIFFPELKDIGLSGERKGGVGGLEIKTKDSISGGGGKDIVRAVTDEERFIPVGGKKSFGSKEQVVAVVVKEVAKGSMGDVSLVGGTRDVGRLEFKSGTEKFDNYNYSKGRFGLKERRARRSPLYELEYEQPSTYWKGVAPGLGSGIAPSLATRNIISNKLDVDTLTGTRDKQLTETRTELGTILLGGTRLGTELLGGLDLNILTRTDLSTDLTTNLDTDTRTDLSTDFDTKLDTELSTEQTTEQLTTQITIPRLTLITPTILTPDITTPEVPIERPRPPEDKIKKPWIPWIPLGGDEEEPKEKKYFKPVKRQKELIKSTSRRRAKGLMADLLSVTQSQARYGKSTQPKLTTKLWKESEKSLFKRVPTQELMKGGRTKADNLIGNKKKGGKKNVYY